MWIKGDPINYNRLPYPESLPFPEIIQIDLGANIENIKLHAATRSTYPYLLPPLKEVHFTFVFDIDTEWFERCNISLPMALSMTISSTETSEPWTSNIVIMLGSTFNLLRSKVNSVEGTSYFGANPKYTTSFSDLTASPNVASFKDTTSLRLWGIHNNYANQEWKNKIAIVHFGIGKYIYTDHSRCKDIYLKYCEDIYLKYTELLCEYNVTDEHNVTDDIMYYETKLSRL